MVGIAPRLPSRLARWARHLEAAELLFDVDPFVLAAILDRESLGGDALTPPGPGGIGDGGHGRGLGQIDDRYHAGFVHAEAWDHTPLWADPAFNILYAAKLMRSNLDAAENDYPTAIAAYNCGLAKARLVVGGLPEPRSKAARIAALDLVTTGGDYVTDVLLRRDRFLTTSPNQGGIT